MVSKLAALLTLGALLSSVASSEARTENIVCQPSQGRNGKITIGLSVGYFEYKVLSCIYGDFVYEMPPCAPSGGGVGLSDPDDPRSLRALGTRWQDYLDHSGGVIGHDVSSRDVGFYGGINAPDTGFTNKWTFTFNRITGEGLLKADGSSLRYACKDARQKS